MDLTQPGVGGAPLVPYPLSIVVSSDGIWDNWKFEEVAAYMLTPGRVADVVRTNSAQTAASELMAANLERGRINFGSSADNSESAFVRYRDPAVHHCYCSYLQ